MAAHLLWVSCVVSMHNVSKGIVEDGWSAAIRSCHHSRAFVVTDKSKGYHLPHLYTIGRPLYTFLNSILALYLPITGGGCGYHWYSQWWPDQVLVFLICPRGHSHAVTTLRHRYLSGYRRIELPAVPWRILWRNRWEPIGDNSPLERYSAVPQR